jgi:hypothetical protein
MYRSEKQFYHALAAELSKDAMIQRIESGRTSAGIPDVYVRYPGYELWLELKNMPRAKLTQTGYVIPWRPGQQAWAFNYHRVSQLCVCTLCALNDGFIGVPMIKTFPNNIVRRADLILWEKLSEVIEAINYIGVTRGKGVL